MCQCSKLDLLPIFKPATSLFVSRALLLAENICAEKWTCWNHEQNVLTQVPALLLGSNFAANYQQESKRAFFIWRNVNEHK